MSFQFLNGAALTGRAGLALGLFTLGFMAELRANPYASAWSAGAKSAARLIAALGPANDYQAGVEIRLDPRALTYWRSPGEAGAAPVFDFGKSENIRSAVVSFPAPQRIDEAGLDMFGYRGEVIFPVAVELADGSRPARLALSLDYAVCSEICLPVRAQAALALPARPGAGSADAPGNPSPEAAALDAARARVPLRLSPAQRDAKILVTRDYRAAVPTWRVAVKADPAANGAAYPDPDLVAADLVAADIFVEFPEGWYFETKKGGGANEFLIFQTGTPHPDAAAGGGATAAAVKEGATIPLTVTLAQPRQSYEFTLDVDAVPQRP